MNRIYTDLAVIEVTPEGFRLVELSPGIDFDYVQEAHRYTSASHPVTDKAERRRK